VEGAGDDEVRGVYERSVRWWDDHIDDYGIATTVLDFEAETPAVALDPHVVELSMAGPQVDVVRILGAALDLDRVRDAALRWETAQERVPGAFDTHRLPAVALDLEDEPVLPIEPGDDSVHVEYAGVWGGPDDLRALYSAYGDDGVWKIRGARSADDGVTWERTGTVIDPSEIGYHSVAFPDVLEDASGDLLVVFSGANDAAGYDDVLVMRGDDVDHLGEPVVVAPVGGLDPAIWTEDGRYHVSFTLAGPGSTVIEHYASSDGESWEQLDPLFDTASVVYTQNTFVLDGTRVWAADLSYGAGRGRESVRLFCRSAETGSLVPLQGGEIVVSDFMEPIWNQYRYGFEFAADGAGVTAYYNGIRRDQGDGNGMIGRTRLDLSRPQLPDECT
jgi:hypothetical protein